MNDFVRISCEKIEEEFSKEVLPIRYSPRGIIASEGFAFCALSKSTGVKMILESGIYEGVSTTIWSNFFQDIPIIAIDKELRESPVHKFDLVPNVQLISGNSVKILPLILQKNPRERIAVFIDGPKSMNAIQLANKCMEFENVVLVGIHDLHTISFGKPNKNRVFLDNSGKIDFYTDDSEFVEKYAYMDSPRNCIGINEGETHWEPGKVVSAEPGGTRSLGSYGRTIGFMIKDCKV